MDGCNKLLARLLVQSEFLQKFMRGFSGLPTEDWLRRLKSIYYPLYLLGRRIDRQHIYLEISASIRFFSHGEFTPNHITNKGKYQLILLRFGVHTYQMIYFDFESSLLTRFALNRLRLSTPPPGRFQISMSRR